ncbi:MAG TPA: AlkA N-terminal domain-containing protein [Terriglobales bacterium]|nr:AlkA N-terminal domain-containing protein [Terriglobales bacterium]
MNLDRQICSQARISRDPRFDGRFFIGVLTSGVYCRSICPARTALERNVRYFPTAAAAAEAGFRPCLRCRPEASPGTPAWLGSSNTVARALRLISEGAMENGGVDDLAERLGIGGRHLRRLFLRYLGATPLAVAHTRRLHFAKKLIDETNLPMGEIAIAAGFGSVRRFNGAFQDVYGRTPRQIRLLARVSETLPENEYSFHLRFRPPFQWQKLLEFLAPRATPGVELVEGDSYRRNISLNGQSGSLAVCLHSSGLALQVRISFPDAKLLFLIIERVRRMFDLEADPADMAEHLKSDPVLAHRIASAPGLRVPGCWEGFELAVRAILGQQVSVKGATTLAGRLVTAFGVQVGHDQRLTHLFPRPEVLSESDVARIGLPQKRAETIRALARAVRDGRVSLESVDNIEQFHVRLRAIPGLGDWTAQYIAMRALGEPDAFPAGDLGLLRGASVNSAIELAEHAEAWRPWRAYAAMYLWQVPENVANKSGEKKLLTMVESKTRTALAPGAD